MKKWGFRVISVALLLVTALIPAGCRGRFPGSTAPLIKIGLIAPFEGHFRARGYEVLYAVKLAVRQWNETNGGAGGYRVELVALDDGGDPALAVQQVRELAVDGDVLGVIGHFTEGTTSVAAPEYAAQELTLIAPGVGAEDIAAAGWVVRLGPSNRLLGEAAARYAIYELSAARLAVLRGQDDRAINHSRQSLADAFAAAAGRLGGTVVLDVSMAEDGWAARLADAWPDLVFLSGGVMESAEAIRLAREAGVEAVFLGGPALGDRAMVQVGGDWAEGTIYLTAAPAGPDLTGGETFVADYQALAGHPPGPLATLAYEATHCLLEAIAQAGNRPSRAAVWQQFREGVQREGLLGTLTCGGSEESAGWPVAIYRIEEGNYPGRLISMFR